MVFLYPSLDGFRNAGDMCGVVDVFGGQLAQLLKLLDHGRNDEVDHSPHHGNDEDERDNDAQSPCGHVHFVLHELHDRVEQIGHEPCDEEWQQHTAEVVHEQENGKNEQTDACPTDKTVECDFFLHRCRWFVDGCIFRIML